MFEDSLMESSGRIKTKSKWWMIATFSINGSHSGDDDSDSAPLSRGAAQRFTDSVADGTTPAAASTATAAAAAVVKPIKIVSEIDQGLHAPTKIPKDIKMIKEEAPPPPSSGGVAGMSGMAGGSAGGILGGMPGGAGNGPKINVEPPKPKGPTRISGGVMAGQIITKTTPIYPPIARAAHVGGTVVLHAIIAKDGTHPAAERYQRTTDAGGRRDGCGTSVEVQALSAEW